MGEFLSSFQLLSRSTAVASCISLMGFVVSLLGYLRILTVSKAIRRDRDFVERLLELPEIQFNLGMASELLSRFDQMPKADETARQQLAKGVAGAHLSLSYLLRHYFDRWERGNPFFLAAECSRKRGAVRRAIYWYERALEVSEAPGAELAVEEKRQCFIGLQRCHFMRFDRESAKSVARRAAKLEISGPYLEEEVRRKGWLLCIWPALGRLARRLWYSGGKGSSRLPISPGRN